MSEKSAVKDLTTGAPLSLILGFALPLLGGMLFQQFYGLVDTLIVGRFLGVKPLAGVGSTGAINFMVIGFVMGVCNGFAIPISQRFGAGDYSAMRRFYANGILLAVLFAAVMTTVVSLLTGNILNWMKTPDDIFGYAYTYILIIFLGIPAVFLYNLTSAAIRALGDSKAPVFFLIAASVINIVLDLVFIIPCGMGVAGAALATDLSQAISGFLCVLYIRRKVPILGIQPGEGKPDRQYISLLIKMGVPMGLQYSITAIGSVILQAAVNSLGSLYVAANTAAGRVLMFLECPFD
ncbi:MAG: MATE family efflux transporter, partial [Lachnospiraceae bacterium]|nr:MATE family efflux transporter [Lachnospiraceae bacterium]